MINILPPEFKEQVAYSRRNVSARHYLIAIILIGMVVGGVLAAVHWYANREMAQREATLESIERDIDQFSETEKAVDNLNQQLSSIESLLEQRPQFSVILEDLASVLPRGSFINGISLTEDIELPLNLLITTSSRSEAIAVRDSLLTSDRISAADIQRISAPSEDGTVDIDIVIGFDIDDTEENQSDETEGNDTEEGRGEAVDDELENETGVDR